MLDLLKNELNNKDLLNNLKIVYDNKSLEFEYYIKQYIKNPYNVNDNMVNNELLNYINTYKVIENIIVENYNIIEQNNINFEKYIGFDYSLSYELNIIHYITTFIIYHSLKTFNSIALNNKSFIVIHKNDLKNFIKENTNYSFSYTDITLKMNDYYVFLNFYENFSDKSLVYNKINFEQDIIIDFLNKDVIF